MITRYIELSCDQDDCTNAYGASPTEITSLRLTRIGALVHGWTRHDSRDYCPDHGRVDELVATIRRLAADRLTDVQIAERVGIDRTTVQKTRAANGIPAGLGRVGRPSKAVGGAP